MKPAFLWTSTVLKTWRPCEVAEAPWTAQMRSMSPSDETPGAALENPFDWPAFGLEDDIRPALARARAEGEASALATLFAVEGGAPRSVGAQMLITPSRMAGFLSGGCIEADVALNAAELIKVGGRRFLVYGSGGPADIRLPCGSRIDILLERLGPHDAAAEDLLALSAARRPALWISDGLERRCVDAEAQATSGPWLEAPEAARSGPACGRRETPFALFRRCPPPLRLILVGGDPVALAVLRMAREMGVTAALVRPKGPADPPFPGVDYFRGDLDAAFAVLKPDPWTAVAVLTHDLDQEHEALSVALKSAAGYVGALGSRRRAPERNRRLEAAGFDARTIALVRAPIGLAIGGKTPWEIAVSILAEVVAAVERPA